MTRKLEKSLIVASLLLYQVAPVLQGTPAQAQPPAEDLHELIVLVAPAPPAPLPEEIVDAVNNGDPVPGGFDEGTPDGARLVITRRATGVTRAWMDENPDRPLARLERYIVLSYPEEESLDAVMLVLSDNPNVENVEENRLLRLASGTGSVLPADPLLDPESGDPALHQWGPHTLQLPEAWRCAKGHAWVGLIDTGLQVDHPDLRTYHRDAADDLVYDGGNFREHLSKDFRFDDCNVDELDPDDGMHDRIHAGHGSHVAGIVAATTDNIDPEGEEGIGVAGACWYCSILFARAFTNDDPDAGDPDFVQAQIDGL